MIPELKTITYGIIPLMMLICRRVKAAYVFQHARKVSDMIKLKDLTGVLRPASLALALAFLISAAAPAFLPTSARAGDGTWQDLVFLYTTDIKGKIEPCG